jgi:hypothetical protein
MPVYHFHVSDGIGGPDLDGHLLAGLADAKREAVSLGGSLIREMGDRFWDGDDWRLEVTDSDGLLLFTLIFSAIIAPTGLRPAPCL